MTGPRKKSMPVCKTPKADRSRMLVDRRSRMYALQQNYFNQSFN